MLKKMSVNFSEFPSPWSLFYIFIRGVTQQSPGINANTESKRGGNLLKLKVGLRMSGYNTARYDLEASITVLLFPPLIMSI